MPTPLSVEGLPWVMQLPLLLSAQDRWVLPRESSESDEHGMKDDRSRQSLLLRHFYEVRLKLNLSPRVKNSKPEPPQRLTKRG
jgi:hypothetical protein